MTTKQEIIDFIRQSDLGCALELYTGSKNNLLENKIIQMIKDLEPKVKKLIWSLQAIHDGINIHIQDKWRSNKGHIIHKENNTYITNIELIFDSLVEAQEACQKHYEENILGELED